MDERSVPATLPCIRTACLSSLPAAAFPPSPLSLRPPLSLPFCRAPIYLGSREEVELIEQFKKEAGAA